MADAITPNFHFTLPEVGSSRDSWGAKLNNNFAALDQLVFMAMPIGVILDFAGPQAPPGWLICDGRLISRVTYSALFGVVGTYWGAGDGATTFALPPTPGRALIGPGMVRDQNGNQLNFSFAQNIGALSAPISQSNLPNFALYCDTQGYHSHGGFVGGSGSHGHSMDTQGDHSHGAWTDVQGTHSHSGSVDAQGTHTHTLTAPTGTASAQAGPYTVTVYNGTITTSADGLHQHNIVPDGAHQHVVGMYNAGGHQHSTWGGDHNHTIPGDGSHAHNVWLNGGGAWFGLIQPVLVATKIIYAGQQAAPQLASLAAPTAMRRLSAPMRGTH